VDIRSSPNSEPTALDIEEYQERIAKLASASVTVELVGNEPPATCEGRLCHGYYNQAPGIDERCPLDGPNCPFHQQRLLRPMVIGARYQSASIDRIASESARVAVQAYLDSIGDAVVAGNGLLLFGGVGAGKTSILALVGYTAAAAGYSVGYWYAGELFDMLHRNDRDEANLEAIRFARQCDMLLLDDFGVQYSADWTVTRFDALIEYRYARMKPMCITTNASKDELQSSDNWRRVYDRWKEMCEGISAGKESMR